jgi:uncharacterized protein
MAKLYKTSNSGAELLLENLETAETFWARGKGLLGRSKMEESQALWIKPCNNIHTCFMNFKIDCIFLDSNMEIKEIIKDVVPFRFVGPFWKSTSVIEVQSGFAEIKNLKPGDQLYVVS